MAQKPQSRFWAASESSESESEQNDSEQEEEVPQKAEEKNKWQYESESSGEDEGQRIVKTARGKAEEAFEKVNKELNNAVNINDWNSITNLFQKLSALLIKHAEAIQGNTKDSIDNYPLYYFRSLRTIQTAIKDLSSDKQAQKKLSKTNSKSFNALRARFKKSMTEELQERVDNVQEAHPKAAKEDASESSDSSSKSDSESSESSSESSESESESEASGSEDEDENEDEKKESKEKEPKSKFFEESEEDWDDQSESSSSSESDEELAQLTGRARWVKRTTVADKSKKIEEKKAKEKEKFERAKQRKLQKEQQSEQRRDAAAGAGQEEMTVEKVQEMVNNIVSTRGKKNVNRMENIVEMRKISQICKDEGFDIKVQLKVLMHLIRLEFDVKTGLDEFLPVELWQSAFTDVKEVVSILEENEDLKMIPAVDEEKNISKDEGGDKEVAVIGDVSVFVDKLNNEYEKSLRYLDNHSQEYIDRLKDEAGICELAKSVFKYLVRTEQHSKAATQCLLTLEHNYYKHETVALTVFIAKVLSDRQQERKDHEETKDSEESDSLFVEEIKNTFKLEEQIRTDCEYIFEYGTDDMKCRAMLCQIYHYAIHDNFYKARDLLLMSRLQDTIYTTDVETQIVFNRMMVQLGICAFRAGKIKESHTCLIEICQQSNKTKELLAQGVSWRKITANVDAKALEAQQKAERRRMMPYHMHINLDLLEFFHLTSAMLLEIPNMAKNEFSEEEGTKVISRSFRRFLDQYTRQVFTGPPENTRDHVLAAALCLKNGEWEKCLDLLINLPIWSLVPYAEKTKKVLLEKIKHESLRTFLLTYSATYSAMSLSYLMELFSLSEKEVRKIVSTMIVNDDIKASWDQVSECVIFHRNELTHVQALAMRCADKLEKIVESNEQKLNNLGGSGFELNLNRKNIRSK